MKRTRAAGGGRKPLASTDPTVKVAITLLSSQVEAAKQLGDGNLSAGIRKAIEETKMETRNLTDNAWVQRVNELSQMVEDMNPAPTSQDDVNWWLTDGWSDLDDDDVTVLRREIKRKYEIE